MGVEYTASTFIRHYILLCKNLLPRIGAYILSVCDYNKIMDIGVV